MSALPVQSVRVFLLLFAFQSYFYVQVSIVSIVSKSQGDESESIFGFKLK